MKYIQVNQQSIPDPKAMEALCPFGAIVEQSGSVIITDGCRMCGICVKKGPKGAFTLQEEQTKDHQLVDKAAWKGIMVYVEHHDGHIHPVSLEMLGKAHQLAAKVGHPVVCVIIGSSVAPLVDQIATYGPDTVVVYEDTSLGEFLIEPYTAAFVDAITAIKPSVVLVGGTVNGRTLAPRCAARLHTGLTADCTVLDIQTNSDLDQIRPAFGGNIMAHIRTPNHRPQFATVRYKIFDVAKQQTKANMEVVKRTLPLSALSSAISIQKTETKGAGVFIEDADVVVALGKGIGKAANIELFERLASSLGGMVACTRPLVEDGWMDPRRQIGLSGRTVKPKLIITCGVSGSVQFVAGMQNAEKIIAINTDADAPIFKVAHIGIVGDVFSIVPQLLTAIEADAQSQLERMSS